MTKYFIVIIVILLALLFLYKERENLDASGLSNEALQNIAKVYGDKDGTVTFNNVKITGNLDVNGVSNLNGGANSGGTLTAGKFTADKCYVNTINASGDITANNLIANGGISSKGNISASNNTITLYDGNIGINGNISANKLTAGNINYTSLCSGNFCIRPDSNVRRHFICNGPGPDGCDWGRWLAY